MSSFLLWAGRRLLRGRRASAAAAPGTALVDTGAPGHPVSVQLPDGQVVEGATIVLAGQPGGPGGGRPGLRIPRWVLWIAGIALVIGIFRRIAAWGVLGALSAMLHLFGVNAHLPHVTFGWPWSPANTQTTLVGPLVLEKIEGIDKPALGSETFDFMFTHSVSKPIGFLPCWYSASFFAVGHASATVDLNPGAAWWKPKTGHYVLKVLSTPSGAAPGKVTVTMALPLPQLPQSVHDVSVDNTLSAPTNVDHSWTYPGLACGVLIKPQFAQSVLYAQAQQEAFQQATTVTSVTRPLIAAAEKEAATIIGVNFITPTLQAVGYKVSSFTINWVPPAKTTGGNSANG
jgi:hypothetical protein